MAIGRTARFGVLACCALVGGCATLLDPYVKVESVPRTAWDEPNTSESKTHWGLSRKRLLDERERAQHQADAYRNAAKDQARFKTGLAVSLVPLNAIGFFHATTVRNDHSDFIPAIGYGSSAALGVGGLLSSAGREAIYVQAEGATLCAMSAYEVFLVEKIDYDAYLDDGASLMTARVRVQGAADVLQAELRLYAKTTDVQATAAARATDMAARKAAGAKGKAKVAAAAAAATVAEARDAAALTAKDVKDAAQSTLDTVPAKLTTAGNTQATLDEIRSRVDSAPNSLGARRMAISAEVDKQVQATEISIDQIKTALGAAALASTQATPAAPKAGTDTKAPGSQGYQGSMKADFTGAGDLKHDLELLNEAIVALDVAQIKADAFLRRQLASEQNATKVATCSVAAQVVLTATPDSPAQVAKDKPLSIKVHAPIAGGAPTVSKLEEGLSTTTTTSGGYDYVVVVAETGKPASKEQTLTISSGSQSVDVGITVTDAKPATSSADTAEPAWLNPDWKKVLAFDFKATSDWTKAVGAYGARHGITPALSGDKPVAGLGDKATQAKAIADKAGDLSAYENGWVSDDNMSKLKAALNTKTGGKLSGKDFDKPTRDAIAKVADGGARVLSPDIVSKLGLTP